MSVTLDKFAMAIILVILDHADVVATWLKKKSAMPIQFSVYEKTFLNLITISNLPGNTFYDIGVFAEQTCDHTVLSFSFFVF